MLDIQIKEHITVWDKVFLILFRATMVDFWQVRWLQWRPHYKLASAYYFAKSRQDSFLAGLTSHGSWHCC